MLFCIKTTSIVPRKAQGPSAALQDKKRARNAPLSAEIPGCIFVFSLKSGLTGSLRLSQPPPHTRRLRPQSPIFIEGEFLPSRQIRSASTGGMPPKSVISASVNFPARTFSAVIAIELKRLQAIILRQEIGPLPIDDLSLGFLFRVDVELVKDHNTLILQIIERPLISFAVR